MKTMFTALFTLIAIFNYSSFAFTSDIINYQGKLMNTDGTPVNGAVNLVFDYYDNESATSEFCSETHNDVSVSKGFFSVKLGPFCADFNAQIGDDDGSWVGITVNEEEMSPRLEITNSVSVLSVNGVGGTTGDSLTVDDDGSVGIGVMNPSELLHIKHSGNGETMTIRFQAMTEGGADPSGYVIFDPDEDYIALSQIVDEASVGVGVGSNGNVGIGTTNPNYKLHIQTPDYSNCHLALDSANRWLLSSLSSGDFVIRDSTHSFNAITINNATGHVGIGTVSPQHRLDVAGTVQAYAFDAGDIVFRKDGKKLWRMFEDEEGLYLENINTGEISKVFLENDIEKIKEEIKTEIMNEIRAELLNEM